MTQRLELAAELRLRAASLCAGLLALGFTACASTPAASTSDTVAEPAIAAEYRLGPADKIRVVVFNELSLSGEFTVGAGGAISLPLIGDVPALGRSTSQLRAEIERRLSQGYLRSPRVSIDVLTFRPFYILGEVNKPGEYAYSSGLTVFNAVARAEGFTYRADQRRVFIKRGAEPERARALIPSVTVQPGDTIRIGERFF